MDAVRSADPRDVGDLISDGRTSEVFRYRSDGALKVLKRSTPPEWARIEASFTSSVRRLGVPAPEVREVLDLDGRAAIHFELIDGPSMWQQMLDQPTDVDALASELASVQRGIHEAGVPDDLPSVVDRLQLKLGVATELADDERDHAVRAVRGLPRGAALLHGDLHPGNVLLDDRGPVVIDWFDATVGHPTADVARTHLLLTATGATDLRHLPGASIEIVDRVHDRYTAVINEGYPDETCDERNDQIERWLRVMAAGRLAEKTDTDVSGLLAIWRTGSGRNDRPELVEDRLAGRN